MRYSKNTTRMLHRRGHADYLRGYGEEVRVFVFNLLDSDPDFGGNEAGLVAEAVKRCFMSEAGKV